MFIKQDDLFYYTENLVNLTKFFIKFQQEVQVWQQEHSSQP